MRKKASFLDGNYVFVDKQFLESAPESSADAPASNTNNELHRRTCRPSCFLEERTNTVTEDENGISNTAFIDRVTPAARPQTKYPHGEARHKTKQMKSIKTTKEKPPKPSPQKATNTNEYVVDQNIQYFERGRHMKYVERWYGYEPAKDMFKPANHIPRYFVSKCRRKYTNKNNSI